MTLRAAMSDSGKRSEIVLVEGLRSGKSPILEYTSQSLKFTDDPVSCRLSFGRVPNAFISRSASVNDSKPTGLITRFD